MGQPVRGVLPRPRRAEEPPNSLHSVPLPVIPSAARDLRDCGWAGPPCHARAPVAGLAGASVLSRAPGGGSAGVVPSWGRRRQTDGTQPTGCAPHLACALREALAPATPPPGAHDVHSHRDAGPALGVRVSGFRVVEPSPPPDVPIAASPACGIGGAAAKTLGTRETGAPRQGTSGHGHGGPAHPQSRRSLAPLGMTTRERSFDSAGCAGSAQDDSPGGARARSPPC